MLKICLSFLVVLLVIAAPARAQDMFKSTTDHPDIKAFFHEFENICVQFVLHQREVSFREDQEAYRKHISSFGFTERDLTEIERTHNQMVNPAPRNFFLKSNPDKKLTIFWEWPQHRLLWQAPSKTPGQWCRLSVRLQDIEPDHIKTHLVSQDPEWQVEPDKKEPFGGTRLSMDQCPTFEDKIYYLNLTFNQPAYLPDAGIWDKDMLNSQEEWVKAGDKSLVGGMLTLTMSRDSLNCSKI